jgi:hypothetical protein
LTRTPGSPSRPANAKVHLVRVADSEPIRELQAAWPVAVVRVAYTPDGKFVIGQTGFRGGNGVVFSPATIVDGKVLPTYHEHTDRVCIWDTADGKLVARLPGSAFADGFGPGGELAVAQARGSGPDAYLEIDLWRPAELVRVLEQEGLTDWVHFSDLESQTRSGISTWLYWINLAVQVLAQGGIAAIRWRIENKRVTIRTVYTAIGLTLLLVAIGILALMAVVAEFTGHWERLFQYDLPYIGIAAVLFGLANLHSAIQTGSLVVKCYTHVRYGEALA